MTPLVTGLMPHQIAKCQTRGPRLPLLKGSPTVEVLKKPATWFCLGAPLAEVESNVDDEVSGAADQERRGGCGDAGGGR